MVRPDSVRNNLTRITEALQAWHINWNIHRANIHLPNPANNLAIPLIPLHVVAGAAGADIGRKTLEDPVMGAVESAFRFG